MALVVLNGLHASVRGMHSTLITVQFGARSVDNRRAMMTDEQCAIFDAMVARVNEATALADELARAIPALDAVERD